MKPKSRFLLTAWFVVVGYLTVTAAPPSLGKALILDNGEVIEGQIERVGERYRIVKDGGETWLPASRIHAVCADLAAAYRNLSGRIAASDAEAHLRLARWCESVGLREQALAETKATLAIKPTHATAQRYQQHLQEAPVIPAAATTPALPLPPAPEPIPIEVGAEALKRFTTMVQPLLMNACGKCHAGPNATAFKLQRVYAGDLNHRSATYWNLAAAAAHIDPANPSASKLWTLAISGHGGEATPPIRDKAPLKTLQDWVTLVASERRPQKSTPSATSPIAETATEPKTENKAEKVTGPADPFDPAIFNRQHHPNSGGPDAEPKRP